MYKIAMFKDNHFVNTKLFCRVYLNNSVIKAGNTVIRSLRPDLPWWELLLKVPVLVGDETEFSS